MVLANRGHTTCGRLHRALSLSGYFVRRAELSHLSRRTCAARAVAVVAGFLSDSGALQSRAGRAYRFLPSSAGLSPGYDRESVCGVLVGDHSRSHFAGVYLAVVAALGLGAPDSMHRASLL